MQIVIFNGAPALTFRDGADLSQWPLVNDSGQVTEVSNIPGPPVVVSAAIQDGTPLASLQYVGGAVSVIPQVIAVPNTITAFQAKAALANAGLYATVDAYMTNTAPLIDKLAWQEQVTFSRNDSIIAACAGPCGLTSAQLDALFIAAAQITP